MNWFPRIASVSATAGILAGFFLVASFAPAQLSAQGLGGPSSVQADLDHGDGLTDPQFRSEFPNYIAPRWFAWKKDLAKKGVNFNVDYLAFGQSSTSNIGEGAASSGLIRFYGNWQATETGSLTFKLEHRHSYTKVAPQFLGLDIRHS